MILLMESQGNKGEIYTPNAPCMEYLPSHFPLFMWPFFTFHVCKYSHPMEHLGTPTLQKNDPCLSGFGHFASRGKRRDFFLCPRQFFFRTRPSGLRLRSFSFFRSLTVVGMSWLYKFKILGDDHHRAHDEKFISTHLTHTYC